ncbi:MAG: AraC family transcriptional regulator [Methylobacter tundripaludum]|nr:AraC family transcriptional regulator [Methylobacter tundripaludum]
MSSLSIKRKDTGNRYVERVNLALRFIHENLDSPIDLKEIAKASSFSIYHFHRIFLALVGETVNDYVGRKRLERAANLLIFRKELSITEIAVVTGFSSSANFAKSFKLYFGVSPSQIRKPVSTENSKIGKLFSKYGKAFNLKDIYPQIVTNGVINNPGQFEEIPMNVKIVEVKEQVACALSSPSGYESASLFKTWDKLIAWACSYGIEDEKQERFAFCHDNPAITPIEKCRYIAAVVVSPDARIVEPFSKVIIPSGKYAVAHYKGTPEGTSNFHMSLYSNWFPHSGFEPDGLPLMEHYLNDVRKDGYVEMEVYIKLKNVV